MTPAERAVEAGAEAMHGVEWRKADWSLAWHEEAETTRAAFRRDAVLAVRAALRALAADPATAGLCAADLAVEMEVGHARQG